MAKAFNIVPNPGYTFTAPSYTAVTSDAKYTVTFTHATYKVTGMTDTTSATHGTDLDITPTLDNQILLGVQYKVGNGNYVTLTANDEDKYIIPGEEIIGDITISYDTVNGSFTFITEYMAAPKGEKIAVLDTEGLEKGGYSLGETYGDMYWSSKYDAYVCFVANDEDAESLASKLSRATVDATKIEYTGDINGDGFVDPTDSAIISAALHKYQVNYILSDLWRFRFDVCDNTEVKVTAQDIMWILNKYTGYTGQ